MTMNYGPDWPPPPEYYEDRRERRRHRGRDVSPRGTLRYAAAVLAAGAVLVALVIIWDLVQTTGLFGHLPMPCSL